MNKELLIQKSLIFSQANIPTREGEFIKNLDEIYDIPTPFVGMRVWCEQTGKAYTITSLASEIIGGKEVFNKVGTFEADVKEVTWVNEGNVSNMNDFVVAGVYDIKGEHTRIDDNLPFDNTGGGHTFHARLEVLDSSISDSSKDTDKCITQKLTLSNRVAGDGGVYIRTGRGRTYDTISWETWGKLQQNIEVGEVSNVANLIDNGIYSGVYRDGNTVFTFVMVVINDYAIGLSPRRVSQFVYGLSKVNGSVFYRTRVGEGNDSIVWGDWKDINEDNIAVMIKAEIKKVNDRISTLIDDNNPDTLDSIKDLINWVNAHGADAAAMLLNIQQNTVKINAEISRAQAKEKELSEAIVLNLEDINHEVERATQAENGIKANATHYNTLHFSSSADHVTLGGKSIDGNNTIGQDIPAATTEKAGVMSAEDKKEQVKMTPLVNGDIIVGQAREIHSRNGKTVTDSFLARTTAGSGTIGDGVATLKSVGGNIVKNLVDGEFANVELQGQIHEIANNMLTITPKYADVTTLNVMFLYQGVVGHKYYSSISTYTEGATKHELGIMNLYHGNNSANNISVSCWNFYSQIGTLVQDALDNNRVKFRCRVTINPGVGFAVFCCPVLIDLTETFGAGNEPTQADCDKLFGTMDDALPQGLSIAKPTEFKSTGYNQVDPNKVLVNKSIENGAIVDKVGSNVAVVPCLPCKIGVGENNGYCIHGAFDEGAEKVYLTPLNPLEVEGELYMHELTKDADKGTYIPQIKGYMLVEVPNATDLCVHFLWSEDCDRNAFEPYYESKVELPTIPEMSEWGLAGIQSSGTLVCDEIDFDRGVYVKRIGCVRLDSLTWKYSNYNDTSTNRFVVAKSNFPNLKPEGNVLCDIYPSMDSIKNDKCIVATNYTNEILIIRDTSITNINDFRTAIQGRILYYELAEPEEYPLPKVANNYTSSDYGVEQFDSVVPCNANNLYYMRSLAGETRNFLDRLMAGLGTSDTTVVADRILAVVNPAVEPANVEPETPIEE